MALRFLVVDAYDRAGREALRRAGCTEAGVLYERVLREKRPEAAIEIAFPGDGAAEFPDGLSAFDGFVWTGSSLNVHVAGDARVGRMIELCRAAFEAGVPQFGSCFAAQLAVTTAGGACARSPKGREFGISRDITLNEAGGAHPLFAGKASRFDALTSHEDEIATLAPGVEVLASNAWSAVQAVAVRHAAGSFWALQYHPEYDLREVARLSTLRAAQLIEQGHFQDEGAARAWAAELEAAHQGAPAAAPWQSDGIPEIENWIRAQVEV